MTPGDAAGLDWYFGVGLSHFETSPFGFMLARAESAYLPDAHAETIEPTARPTAETRTSNAHEPDHHVLVLYGDISRRLHLCSTTTREVLCAWHGDVGAVFARAGLREACLFFAVPAGRRILLSLRSTTLQVHIRERLVNEIARLSERDRRDQRFKSALTQARELYASADAEYSATHRCEDAACRRCRPHSRVAHS